MSYMTRNLRQTTTYWPPGVRDKYNSITPGSAVSTLTHWEDRLIEFRDETGDTVGSKAVVYLSIDVAVGGYLYLGASTSSDPRLVDGAREVRQFEKRPNIKGTLFERRAFL